MTSNLIYKCKLHNEYNELEESMDIEITNDTIEIMCSDSDRTQRMMMSHADFDTLIERVTDYRKSCTAFNIEIK